MTESIKFGPEWLRNMTDGATTRHTLAKFRYSREEMLSIFDEARQLPNSYPLFKNLFIDKLQNPLAMTPDTENEVTSLDRGRHGCAGSGFQRFSSTEGGRVRSSWNGGQMASERNNGAVSSPKKDYITQLENWRKGCQMNQEVHYDGEDINEARRQTKSRPQSWREDEPSALHDSQPSRPFRYSSSGEDRFFSKGLTEERKGLDNISLPEWVLEKAVQGGGSFDRTGSFHGSDEPPTKSISGKDEATKIVAKTNDNDSSVKMPPVATEEPSTLKLVDNEATLPQKRENQSNQDSNAVEEFNIHTMVDNLFMDEEENNGVSMGPFNIAPNILTYGQQQHKFICPLSVKNSTEPNSSDEWMYIDPQGNEQGPFSATEMVGWYRASYFDDNLYVRRANDTRYVALGDLVRLCGNAVPFELGRFIPPLHQMDMFATVLDIQQRQPVSTFEFQKQMIKQRNREHEIMMQSQHLRRDHSFISQKIKSNEPQNFPVNPRISQIPQPEHNLFYRGGLFSNQTNQQLSMSNTAATAACPMLHPRNISPELAAIYDQILKQQSSPYGPSPSATNASESVQPLMNMYQLGLVPPFLNSTPMHPIAQTAQLELDKDPIKNLLMQIARQKGQQNIQSIPNPEDKSIGSLASGITHPHVFPHQMTEQLPINMWEIPMPPSKLKVETHFQQDQQQKDWFLEQRAKQVALHTQQMQQQEMQTQHMLQQQLMQQKLLQQKLKEVQYKLQEQEQQQQRILQNGLAVEKRKVLKLQQQTVNESKQEADEELPENSTPLPLPFITVSKRQTKDKKGKTSERKNQLLEKKCQRHLEHLAKRDKLMEGLQPFHNKEQSSTPSASTPSASTTAAIAPWSSTSTEVSLGCPLSLTEIQNAERDLRLEHSYVEPMIRGQKLIKEVQIIKDNALNWNLKPQNVKTLDEIQAEETKRQQTLASDQEQQKAMKAKSSTLKRPSQFATICKNNVTSLSVWNLNKMWGNTAAQDENLNNCGFWEKPAIKIVTDIPQKPHTAETAQTVKSTKKTTADTEFTDWCHKALSAHANAIDVPTFVGFLKGVDSPFEVTDYIRTYLGDTKEGTVFTKNFLERRNKCKQRTENADTDDLCQPAQAITPSNDIQKGKSNKKEKKKNRMKKLNTGMLGFSVTAAEDRLNIGDLDYWEAP